jgi:1-acyl-sn-glycerol-3-phosphate acyltransferase
MSNYESTLDILLEVSCLPYNIIILAKKELFMIPVFGWAMQAAGMIKIDRQNQKKAKQSVNRAIEKLTGSKFST